MANVKDFIPPPTDVEALKFLRAKGLRPAFSYREVWAQQHAHAFTVAKIMQADVLLDIQTSLAKALESGENFDVWKAGIPDGLSKMGWNDRRLKLIYNVNVSQARHAGKWARAQETKDVLPYFEYMLGQVKTKHREEHARWAGMVLPVDDPLWNTHAPRNGYGCHCWLRQITRAQAEKKGIGPRPEIKYRTVTNTATGQTMSVPEGIDPGFAYNPGKEALSRNLIDRHVETLEQLPPLVARAVIGDIVNEPAFVEVLKQNVVGHPIGRITDDVATFIGTGKKRIVQTSEKLGDKTSAKPADEGRLLIELLRSIPALIEHANLIIQDKPDSFALFTELDGKPYKVVLGYSRDEIRLVSYARTSARKIAKKVSDAEALKQRLKRLQK